MEKNGSLPPVKERFVKAKIEVRASPIHRYGVFAVQDITAKELIEECPVIIVSKLGNYCKDLWDRVFCWDDANDAIVLGYGSMYNHKSDANAKYSIDQQNQVMRFIAAKDIVAGTEILINYGNNWFTSRTPPPSPPEKLPIEPQSKFCPASLVLGLLLFLLVLSKIFPIDLYRLSEDANHSQSALISTKTL